jgi:hypothetical protein
MTWFHQDNEVLGVPDGYIGFVYLIIRLRDNKRYVGQKVFHSKVTKPPLKGQTRKRRSLKESDWQQYFGSNAELKADVLSEGRDGFRREILHLCKTKSECNYLEAKEIMVRDAIISDDYWNGWLSITLREKMLTSLK